MARDPKPTVRTGRNVCYSLAMSSANGRFCFYELRTIDLDAAQRFYQAVFGERLRASSCADGSKSLHLQDVCVGSITMLPPQAIASGAPSHWLGHIGVESVDAVLPAWLAEGAIQLGPVRRSDAGVAVAPLRDPLGSVVAITDRTSPAQSQFWHELNTKDEARALALYGQLLGWQATDSFDPGLGIGPYQQFAWSSDGDSVGGMVSSQRLPGVHPHWLFYFPVNRLDEAMAQVTQLGGDIYHGPRQMPNGAWVAQCEDPQGAVLGLLQAP